MRYAIVSDIHANLQAWNAVLLDIRSSHVDRIVCLGDIVGYGPDPRPVLESVYAQVDHFVLGNHDAALCGKLDATLFNESAQEILTWTRRQLGGQALRFLRSLPLSLAGTDFRCAHGDFSAPGQFNYVFEAADAMASWQAVPDRVLFLGHTHQPGLFLLGRSGTPHRLDPQDFAVEDEKRFLVNVGSVGHSRDGDVRASYGVFDTGERAFYWRRIPFDLDAYRRALEAQGIPAESSHFLSLDPRRGARPVRETLSFSPPATPDRGARNAVPVQGLDVLQKRVRRWRGFAVALAAALLAFAAAVAWGWHRYENRAMELPDPAPAVVDACAAEIDSNLLSRPGSPSPPGVPVRGWTLRLGNRYRQRIEVRTAEDGSPVFAIESHAPQDEIRILSPAIHVAPKMTLGFEALFRKDPRFAGTVAAALSLTKSRDGRETAVDLFASKEPQTPPRHGEWWEVKQSTGSLPAGAQSVRFEIRGKFEGAVEVKALSLVRRK